METITSFKFLLDRYIGLNNRIPVL